MDDAMEAVTLLSNGCRRSQTALSSSLHLSLTRRDSEQQAGRDPRPQGDLL